MRSEHAVISNDIVRYGVSCIAEAPPGPLHAEVIPINPVHRPPCSARPAPLKRHRKIHGLIHRLTVERTPRGRGVSDVNTTAQHTITANQPVASPSDAPASPQDY